MAHYAILMFADPATDDATETNDPGEARAVYDRHADDLEESGAMVAAFALRPAAYATSIRGDVVTDGPFLDTKEVIPGFYVIEAPDLDAALDIARRNPILQHGGGLEIRPVESYGIFEKARTR